MFQTLKTVLKHPTQNYQAKKMSGWQTFAYLLLLSLIIAIPFIISSFRTFNTIQDEYVEIINTLPEFTIQDGTIQTETPAETFIYQGSGYVFYFDPNGEISQDTVENNTNVTNGLISLGFFDDSFDITLLDSTIDIDYNQLAGLTKGRLIGLEEEAAPAVWLSIFTIIPIVIVYFSFTVLLNAVLTYIFTMFIPVKYSFSDRFKMSLTALTWPIIITSVMHLFGLYLAIEYTISRLASFIIFYYGIRKDLQNTIKK